MKPILAESTLDPVALKHSYDTFKNNPLNAKSFNA